MSARMLPPEHDPITPATPVAVTIIVDGTPVSGVAGQSVAGVLLAAGRLAWRTTAAGRRPRGVFCGIGVCFDCLVTVNGVRDVRACQRTAHDGDAVGFQDEELPEIGA
ncbi:MAG TPA: (2Fe-2S)-binding protein [Gryllotalpicola sp.]